MSTLHINVAYYLALSFIITIMLLDVTLLG